MRCLFLDDGLLAMSLHAVAQRGHELGIRIALGARPASIVKLVLRAGMLQIALGLAVGMVCTAIWDHIFASPNMLTAPDNLRSWQD